MGWKAIRHYWVVYSTVGTQLGMNTKEIGKDGPRSTFQIDAFLSGKRSDDCTAVPVTNETNVSQLPSVQVESQLEFLIQSLGSHIRKMATNWRGSRKYDA